MSDSYDAWRKRITDEAKKYSLDHRVFISYVESSQDARFLKSVACEVIDSYKRGERKKMLKDSSDIDTFRDKDGRFGFTEEMVNLMLDVAIQHGYRRGKEDGLGEGINQGVEKEQVRMATLLGLPTEF